MKQIEKKVAGGATAGAAVTVLVFLAGLVGLDMPAEVAAAVVTVVAAVVGYLIPHTPRPDVVAGGGA